MELNILITIMLPLIGAGIGYLIKHYIEKKKELLNEVNKERRVLYQQFVDLIIENFKDGKNNKQINNEDLINTFYDFYKKYILYASPEVIISLSDYFQYIHSNSPETKYLTKLTRIMLEMRKDLGLSDKKLGKNGEILLRALITDFDSEMK